MTDDKMGNSQDRRTLTGALSDWGSGSKPGANEAQLRKLGRYTDLELIGRGGMGSVYKAWDPQLNRTVALKVLARPGEQARARFLREARSQAQVNHANVCEIYEVGEVDETPFIAMQYISGHSLAAGHVELDLETRVRVVRDVAWAIHAAHERGLIHRDVKPSNIMLEPFNGDDVKPVVVDFGLSKSFLDPGQATVGGGSPSAPDSGGEAHDLTRDGDVTGTPAYMAPEQALGLVDRLDARTDVYALGCTLYQLLAGRPPLVANSAMSLLLMATSQAPVRLRDLNPKVAADLEAVVNRCLEKDPDDRYQTAIALADDLDRALTKRPVTAFAGGPLYVVGRWIRRQPVLASLLVVLFLGATVATASWIRQRWEVRRQAEVAQRFGQEVARLEGFLWKVRSLSPHDTTPHTQVVRERLQGLEQQMEEAGDPARGPGYAALGSTHLALGQLNEARQHFEAAWELGYRGPEVAHGLGVTLSGLYQQGMNRLETISEEEGRQAERLRLESEFRDRALFFLERSGGATLEAPQLVSGLIALCEGRFEEAVAEARSSFADKPWIYQAKLLEGDALMAEALELADHDGGLDMRPARAAYREAVDVAPSDPQCRLRLAGLQLRILGRAADIEHRVFTDDELTEAVAHARQAIEIDAKLPSAHVMLANILTAAAMNGRAFETGEPVELFEGALAAIDEARQLSPSDATVLAAIGRVSTWRAVDAMRWGGLENEAIEALLEDAISSLQIAVGLQATYNSYNLLGVASRRRGIWRGMRGLECAEDFERATTSFEAAIDRFPDAVQALHNLASVLHAQAYFAAPELSERVGLLEQSVAAYRRMVERHPDDPEIFYSMGQAEADLASATQEQGGDPVPLFDRSIVSFERAVELFPGFSQAQRAAGYGLVLKAEYLLDHGVDPAPSLDRAQTWLEAACEHEGFASPWVTLGGMHRVRASRLMLTGGDPIPHLAASVAAYRTSLELRSGRPDVFVGRARTNLVHARYLFDSGKDPRMRLQDVRSDIDAAVGFNPKQWQAEASRAEADLIEIRWRQKLGGEVDELFDSARMSLEAEAANNPSDRLRLLVAGELALCRANQALLMDSSTERAVADGVEALSEVLASDLSSAHAHVLVGRLHLWAAEHGRDASADHAKQAVSHLVIGLEINPYLESRFGEDLRRAESFVGP